MSIRQARDRAKEAQRRPWAGQVAAGTLALPPALHGRSAPLQEGLRPLRAQRLAEDGAAADQRPSSYTGAGSTGQEPSAARSGSEASAARRSGATGPAPSTL